MSLGLHPIVKLGLRELRRDARRAGVRFVVSSGFRSISEQRRLLRRFISGDPRQILPVAEPGRSTHNWGLAVDVVAPGRQADLIELALRIGWVWGGPRDPVHLQIVNQADWSAALARSPSNPLEILVHRR